MEEYYNKQLYSTLGEGRHFRWDITFDRTRSSICYFDLLEHRQDKIYIHLMQIPLTQ